MAIEKPSNQSEVDEMAAPFYRALGQATARWQHAEAGMFVLAHALLRTEYRFSSAVFFHIQSADSKAQLLDKLCRIHFDEKIIEAEWKPLLKELTRAIGARNRIAHYEVGFVPLTTGIFKPREPPVVLGPHHLDLGRQSKGSIEVATTHNLLALGEQFFALALNLLRFVARHFPEQQLRATHLPPRLLRYLENSRNSPPPPAPPPQPSSLPNRKERRAAQSRDRRV
jgi:hypothetical protein